ncbi:MAG: DUF1090 domain-containing protein [Ruminococcaceae bacterium]|nr:DUF1090 domain-containing protein [Oscillospiraceae bacterium]
MGFGWLFVGYFVANFMSLHQFGAIFRMIGYGMMLGASVRLCRYHRSFLGLEILSLLMVLLCGVLSLGNAELFAQEFLLKELTLLPETVYTVFGHGEQWLMLALQAALLWAIRSIAVDIGVPKIAVSATRNFIFVCMYYVVYAISLLPIPMPSVVSATVAIIAWILFFAWMILNQILLFSCYAKICDEDDVEMEQKPSRFAFVNQFRREVEQKEQKAREADALYREEKQKKRMEKAKRRKK